MKSENTNLGASFSNFLGDIAGMIFIAIIISGPLYLVWNFIIVPKFNVPALAYFDVFVIFVAIKLLFPDRTAVNATFNIGQGSKLDKDNKIG